MKWSPKVVSLLEDTIEHVEETPEEHYQAAWSRRTPCGTQGCFAGNAVILAGGTLVFSSDRDNRGWQVQFDDCPVEDIEDAARRVLGLNYEEGVWLFASHRTVEELRQGVDSLIERGHL